MNRLSDAVVGHLRDVTNWPELPPDRYAIRAMLGRGGMGTVFAAYDQRLDREVAIKVSNAAAAGGGLEARLRQEARVLGRLEHPGIVPVHDAGELGDGRWYYVMKLVRGRTLQDQMPDLTGEAARLGVFERVADAVAFAHAAGIIHRDLKPSNVMIGGFGEVLVLDWGLAKVLDEFRRLSAPDADRAEPPATAPGAVVVEGREATAAGTRIGTAGFMAPELQRGDASVAGPAADVYSLGAILFWMLTGRPAPATTDQALRDLASLPERPSRRLRAIVGKCLDADAGWRYADAGALVADLARYRDGAAVVAHPEGPLERAGRWVAKYRTFILLVAAYLVMRALFAWFR